MPRFKIKIGNEKYEDEYVVVYVEATDWADAHFKAADMAPRHYVDFYTEEVSS